MVDEFYVLHETLRHMLNDLRAANIPGNASQKVAEDMGEALTNLRQLAKQKDCSFKDLV